MSGVSLNPVKKPNLMARKPHPSSVLKTLPDEDQEALFAFLRDKTLADGVAWLFANNGLRTNDSSLSEWRGWYEMTRTIGGWNDEVEELKEMLSTQTNIDPNLIPKIGEAVFINKAAKTGDAKTFVAVASIIQRDAELKSNQQQHGDKMAVKQKELAQRDQAIKQKDKVIDMQKRKIEALEEQANATKKIAENAKAALTSGGMDEETRQKLMQEMDRMILGAAAAKKKEAS